MYNSIPRDIKPPPGLDFLHYLDGFDIEMAYQLRETNPGTLEDMQSNIVNVEANLLMKKSKMKLEIRLTTKKSLSLPLMQN